MKLLTLHQVADKVGVSRQTIRNWTEKGLLPIVNASGNFYIDEDALKVIETPIREVEMACRLMEKERDEYFKERDEYKHMRHDVEYEKARDKYIGIAINRCIHTQFFGIVIRLLMANSDLTEKEGDILLRLCEGSNFLTVGEEYHMNRERIRQLVEKAFRKARNLSTLQERIDKTIDLEKENKALRTEVELLRNQLSAISPDEKTKNMSDKQKERWQKERERLIEVLSMDVKKCGFSTRTLNVLRCIRVKDEIRTIHNIAELCALDKFTLLVQHNFGKGSLNEIIEFLAKYGLKLGMDMSALYRKYVIEL